MNNDLVNDLERVQSLQEFFNINPAVENLK